MSGLGFILIILIIMIVTYDGNSVTTARFSNKAACETARDWTNASQPVRYGYVKAQCFPENRQ